MSQSLSDDYQSNESTADIELVPCSICGRTFQPSSLAKHSAACERSATIKRPVFNSFQKRLEGTELARYNSYPLSPWLSPSPLRRKPNNHVHNSTSSLNSNHEHRSARNSTVSRPLGKNERCNYCDRQFGPKAYDDHVKWCKEQNLSNKIHRKMDSNLLEAKERLDARVRYRVPPVQKSKRVLIKEKYSTPSPCPLKRTESVNDLTVDKEDSNLVLLKRTTSLRRPKNSYYSPKTPSTPLDLCDRSRTYFSTLSSNNSNKSTEYDYNPFELAERQFLELLQCDDFKILSEDKTKNNQESCSSLHQKQPTISISSVPVTTSTSTSSLIPSIKKSFPKFNFFRKNASVPKASSSPSSPSPQSSTPCKILTLTKNNLEEHSSPIKTVTSFSNDQFEYIDDNASSLNSYHSDNSNYFNRKQNGNNHCMNINYTTATTKTNKLLNDDFRGQHDNDNGEHQVSENGFTDNSDDNNNNRYQNDDLGTHEESSRPQRRQSKFCHECGTRYPIETAKFCIECGVRRLLF